MTKEEYIEIVRAVLKQYDDGAILAAEVVGKLFAESNHATNTDWYDEEWKLIDESGDDYSDKAPSWLRKASI